MPKSDRVCCLGVWGEITLSDIAMLRTPESEIRNAVRRSLFLWEQGLANQRKESTEHGWRYRQRRSQKTPETIPVIWKQVA